MGTNDQRNNHANLFQYVGTIKGGKGKKNNNTL